MASSDIFKRQKTSFRRSRIKRGGAILLALLMFLATALSGCGSAGQGGSPADPAAGSTGSEAAAAGNGEDSDAETAVGPSGKALTLMLYLCGSDLESKTGAATRDLEEIVSSGVNTDLVNVVVMAGGTTQWQNGFSHEETAVYALTAGSGSADGETSGADGTGGAAGTGTGLTWEKKETFASQEEENAPANMGESGTLKSFLDYSHDRFPADKYALIMWDHGGGPMRGLCWDTAWAKDGLTMEEFTGALKGSPFAEEKLSWIGFDACLMSSVETAHLIAPYAEYMIASEETEPCVGWSYDYLAGIEKDKNGGETGVRIVDSFMAAGEAASEAADKESSLTLACMDLSQLDNVEEKMDSFFAELDESLSPESFSELSNLREDTREFGKAINDSQRYDLVDLGDLVDHYEDQAPEQAAAFKEALDQMVVYSKSNLDNCSGLSAYHPYYNKTYYEKMWRDVYDSFAFAPDYTEYIKKFADIWLGDAMGDWTQMSQVQSAGTEGETQYFSVQLTPEQMQYYASSELLILDQAGSEDNELSGTGYAQVYVTDRVSVDENGLLTAAYKGRTLYAVDENGEILAGPLGYGISDDGNLQIEGNYINDESGAERTVTHAMFECADAPSGTNLPLLEQYVGDEVTGTWSNRIEIDEEHSQSLNLLFDYKNVTRDGDTIRPFSEWEDSTWRGGYQIPLPQEVHFRFFDNILSGSTLYACFEISDTQANRYGTELMEVNNPNITPISFEEGEKYSFENDYLRMTVSGNLDSSEGDESLNLHILIENLYDKNLSGRLHNQVKLADESRTCTCIPSRGGISFYDLAPGESEIFDISFDKDTLAGLTSLKELSFVMDLEEENPIDDIEDTETTLEGEEAGSGSSTDTAAAADSGSSEEQDMSLEMVLHPVDLDLSPVSGAKEYNENPSGLAECTQGDLRWTLRSINVKRDGIIRFAVGCINNGKEPAVLDIPKEIAVNDIVLNTYSGLDDGNLTIGPGEEFSAVFETMNIQYQWTVFNHLSGSHHLTISNVLKAEGEKDINSVSLYFAEINARRNESEADLHKLPVRFELSEAFPLDTDTADKAMSGDAQGDGTQEASTEDSGTEPGSDAASQDEGGEDKLTEEEMTRALDADGAAPVRTELYSQDGITVYGEHILLADTTILVSFVLENKSDQDSILKIDNWRLNDGEKSGSFSDSFIAFANTKTRIYAEHDFYDEAAGEPVSQISMTIRQEKNAASAAGQESDDGKQTGAGQETAGEDQDTTAEEMPKLYSVVFTFPDGSAFDLDGGLSLSVEETKPEVTSLSSSDGESVEIFDPEVKYPDNPDQYKKDFTFTLPDTLTEEERASVKDVVIEVDRDCTSDLEAEDKQEYLEEYDVGEGSSLLCLETLTLKAMQRSEDENIFTCSLSGLICTMQENPDIFYSLIEYNDDQGGTMYRMIGNSDMFCSWKLMPKEEIYSNLGLGLKYSFDISTGNGTASLSGFEIDNGYEEDDFSRYPLTLFKSLEYYFNAPVYICSPDGSMEYKTMVDAGLYSIPLEGSTKALQMVPYSDFTSDLKVSYTILFEDGSSRVFDGGTY